jgi:transcriptional regulator with XRE-family HTH domain
VIRIYQIKDATTRDRNLAGRILAYLKQHGQTQLEFALRIGMAHNGVLSRIIRMEARPTVEFEKEIEVALSSPPPRPIHAPVALQAVPPQQRQYKPEGLAIQKMNGRILQLENRIAYLEDRLGEACGAVIADMLLSAPPKCVECWGWLAPPLHPSPADQIEAP